MKKKNLQPVDKLEKRLGGFLEFNGNEMLTGH
jgi:hypothetical protein